MPLLSKQLVFVSLRFLAVSVLSLSAVMVLLMFIATTPHRHSTSLPSVETATLNLEEYKIKPDASLVLEGQWQSFPGVYFDAKDFDRAKLENPRPVRFPITRPGAKEKFITYRCWLQTNSFDSNMVFYIPDLRSAVNIFINGQWQPSMLEIGGLQTESTVNCIFPITAFDKNLAKQELVISVSQKYDDNTLYLREIILSSEAEALNLNFTNMSRTMFILGMLVLILISSYIFMLFRPEHKVISLITVLDSLLILRLIFEVQNIKAIESAFSAHIDLSDNFLLSLQMFFLMAACITGIRLVRALFHSEKCKLDLLLNVLTAIYTVALLIFPFNLPLLFSVGKIIILFVYVLGFCVILLQCLCFLKTNKSAYDFFQALKTFYVGCVIFIDIYFFGTITHPFMFVYLYTAFFMAHVVTRLYDNNNSYKEVENLNANLEKTVAERTNELLQANRVLSELSERDFLTGAYNRLYFENVFERTAADFDPQKDSVHLCIFDLDNFKKINDTYGHAVGDKQLKMLVQLAGEIIDSSTVLARIGGEEFILLFRGASSDNALATVEKIRKRLEAEAKRSKEYTTASFGLVKMGPHQNRKEVFKLADKCLYMAKRTGKNKIVALPDDLFNARVEDKI